MAELTAPACINPNHEHLTEFDANGEDLGCLAPMTCSHCKRPAHYSTSVEDYAHDAVASDAVCFLMGPSEEPCVIAS